MLEDVTKMPRIYKRGDSWGIDYVTQGGRVREIVAPNKALAEIILKKRMVEVVENKHLDVKNIAKVKFEDFAQEFIDLHLKPNRPTWWKSEKHNIDHLVKHFGSCLLHEIRVVDVERFKIEYSKALVRGVEGKIISRASVNKILGCLKVMFNKAIEWERFSGVNPVTKVKFYKLDNQRTRYLEKEEIPRLLAACGGGYLRDIVEFAINTGMRKGEIFGLKWREVDLRQGVIHLLKTKNGEQREVPINKTVEDILYRVRKNPDNPYVFNLTSEQPVKEIRKSYKTALKSVGIENFRFHDLRHTFASQLVMAGVDLNTVRDLLGHKDIKMTLRYSHLSCNHKKLAVNALDRLNGTNMAQSHSDVPLTVAIPITCEV